MDEFHLQVISRILFLDGFDMCHQRRCQNAGITRKKMIGSRYDFKSCCRIPGGQSFQLSSLSYGR